jgi:dolichyl-phosphate-mannose--protein O-mannosyl transferase
MFQRIRGLIKFMHSSNMRMTAEHEASSRWWEWPLVLMQSITYFNNRYSLVLHPSPFVWYPAAVGPLLLLGVAAFGYCAGNAELCNLAIWPIGYFASWLPFALIPRVIFVYHYLIPLIFGVFSFAVAIDVLLKKHPIAKSCFFASWSIAGIGSWPFFAP